MYYEVDYKEKDKWDNLPWKYGTKNEAIKNIKENKIKEFKIKKLIWKKN